MVSNTLKSNIKTHHKIQAAKILKDLFLYSLQKSDKRIRAFKIDIDSTSTIKISVALIDPLHTNKTIWYLKIPNKDIQTSIDRIFNSKNLKILTLKMQELISDSKVSSYSMILSRKGGICIK